MKLPRSAPRPLLFLALFSLSLLALGARPARADHCQPAAPLSAASAAEPQLRQRLSLGYEIASYENSRYQGAYEGLHAGWEAEWRAWAARLDLPLYRLTRNGLTSSGLGDVFVEGRFSFFEGAGSPLRLGLSVASTLPSGSAADELGMGHFMLFGGVWARLTEGPWSTQLSLSYAGALGSSGTHEHGTAPRPLVSPMNPSELIGSWAGSYQVAGPLRLRASLYAAAPVVQPGTTRAVAAFALEVVTRHFDSALEAQAPLAGDPFSAKLVTSLGVRY